MLVHLTASTMTLREDADTMRKIKEQISHSGHKLLKDWISPAQLRISQETEKDPATVFSENMELVSKSEAVIAEVTHDSFGVGYQVATAVQLNKPILLLSQKSHNSKMLQGLENSLVSFKEYNPANLGQIINEFLLINNVSAKDLRFNFFIDREIHNYLRWVSYKTGRSKSKILRDIIRKEIGKAR